MIVYDDHVAINSTEGILFSFARTPYFDQRLEGLEGFYGFFPRTYLPQTKIYRGTSNDDWTKMTLFFIDSRKEIKVGVGLNFPVCPLDPNEIQIHRDVANSLDVGVGDLVSFKI